MAGYLHACVKPVRCQECWDRARTATEGQQDMITDLRAQLRDREEKLEAVEEFVEEQYKDGVCLWCGWQSGGSLEFHCCWVGHLDRILKGGD